MKIDEFTKYLEGLPKEVSWYMENTRFKGCDLVEAQIFFSLPYPKEDDYIIPDEQECKNETRIEELEKQCWEHFHIHQEVFNYLLSKGYIGEIVEGDNWEAAAQNIINGIKNIEGKLK